MSNHGAFRPYPPSGTDALPGRRDPHAYFYVAHGADCVLLCNSGQVARWRNAVVFTPDEARRLGMQLMAQADAAEALSGEAIAERASRPLEPLADADCIDEMSKEYN